MTQHPLTAALAKPLSEPINTALAPAEFSRLRHVPESARRRGSDGRPDRRVCQHAGVDIALGRAWCQRCYVDLGAIV